MVTIYGKYKIDIKNLLYEYWIKKFILYLICDIFIHRNNEIIDNLKYQKLKMRENKRI